jgi:hypothetical protein
MNREIGSAHWQVALDCLKARPVWEFIIVKATSSIPTQERLNEAIQEPWCYVIFRIGGEFEKVTYHNGKRIHWERC